MRKAKIFLINGVILTSTSLLTRGAGLIFNIYIANQVGSTAIGIFSLIMSVYNFAITVATSGLSISCTCIVSEEFEKKNYITGIKAVRTCKIFALLLGIFAGFFIILLAPIISKFWLKGAVSNIPIYTIALGLPFISISSVIGGYFSSVGKSYKSAIAQTFELTIKMIASIIFLHFAIPKGVEAICISLILADVISEIFSFSLNSIFYTIDKRKYCQTRNMPIQMKRKIFNIAFPIAITSCIKSGLSSLKQFLIPLRLELSGLTYSMAVSQYGLISGMVMPVLLFANVFITSFSGLLVPEFSRLLAGENYNRLKTVSNTIFQITFIFSICIGSIFFFYSDEISLAIYQNLESAKWIKILAPLVLLMYVDNIVDGILKGINEQVGVMCCNIIDLLVTICIIFFLVPKMGITGYIFSIFVSEILNFVISCFQLRHRIKYHIRFFKSILMPICASILAFLVTNIFTFSFSSILYSLIFKICVFSSVYVGILFIVNYKVKSRFFSFFRD